MSQAAGVTFSAGCLRLFDEEAMGPSGDPVEAETMSDIDEYDAAFIGNRPVEELLTYSDADMDVRVVNIVSFFLFSRFA